MPVGSEGENEVAVQEPVPQTPAQTKPIQTNLIQSSPIHTNQRSRKWIVGVATFAVVVGALTFKINVVFFDCVTAAGTTINDSDRNAIFMCHIIGRPNKV